ncbi:MAG: radical SAM protein [Spirochaetaceae bacterium]|jgi:radical SAM protein with 4Fe4S-binding SPASM domain|nr:radical SAM protein [Spirochaetaceae bacterium]
MKYNFSVVPMLFKNHISLALSMFYGFFKMALTRIKPKRGCGYNHFKNLCLLYIKLTPLCNLNCVMCGQRGDKGVLKNGAEYKESKHILPFEQYKKLIDEAAAEKPVIYLWGGEPFLYPDLFPLIRYAVEKDLFVSVNTNGVMLERCAEQIVRDKWSAIFVSLDAFRDVNDRIRGKGSYDRVIAGFNAINREKERQKSKLPVMGIVTTITNMNYDSLEALCDASREWNLGVHIFNLGTYTNDAIVDIHKKFILDNFNIETHFLEGFNTGYNKNIDAKKLYSTLQKIHHTDYGHPVITVPALNPEKIHQYYNELEKPVRVSCIVPWCQVNINYNGDVHFCADYPDYILGNITEQSLKEIYNGERANKFRKLLSSSSVNGGAGIFPGCLRCYQNMLFGKKPHGY